MKRFGSILVIAAAVAAGSVSAQTKAAAKAEKPAKAEKKAEKPAAAAAAPAAPKPDPAMGQLKMFAASWTCKGQAEASPFGPAHPTTAKVHGEDLGGYWLTGTYREDKTAANPMPYHFVWTWGYDAKEKKFDAWAFDAMGGTMKQESKGWEGDKMVFTGEAHWGGQTMPVRDTFTKKSENELVHMGEMQQDGKWAKLDEETCTKGGGAKK